MDKHLTEHQFSITRAKKEEVYQTKGTVLWLMGLSGSGKSTIASALEELALNDNKIIKILDGDSVRSGLCQDLGFSQSERQENLRRVAEVAKLFAENATLTICCFITPLEVQREAIKNILGDDFQLIYIDTTLEECEKRDPKQLYKKAKAGEIKNFTGIDSVFEAPKKAQLNIETQNKSAQDCAQEIYQYYLESIC